MSTVSQADSKCQLNVGQLIEGRWKVVSKLGEGSFGAVYEAQDIKGQFKENMALKLESQQARDQVLKMEVAVLNDLKGCKHACHIYSGGRNDRFNFVLMSLLGPSVDHLRHNNGANKSFSMSTSVRLLHQCLAAIQDVHESGWLHRDIKPSNFAIGPHQQNRRTIYIFDFGLARAYMTKNKDLRPPRSIVGFRGTLRYCSINCHQNKELGRHDDIISLLFMFVEMVKGVLPWSHLVNEPEVYKSKLHTYRTLFNNMHSALPNIHNYLYTLKYHAKPEYTQIDSFAQKLIKEKNYEKELYDWEKNLQPKKYNPYAPVNSASKLYLNRTTKHRSR